VHVIVPVGKRNLPFLSSVGLHEFRMAAAFYVWFWQANDRRIMLSSKEMFVLRA
jgi:hypothetical protein